MHPDLVGASGFDGDFQQTVVAHQTRHSNQRDGALSVGVVFGGNSHPAFAFAHTIGNQIALQRQVNDFFIGRPLAFDQRQIGFAGFAVAELVLQTCERAAFFGHQQHA